MKIIEILRDVIVVMGEAVLCFLEKVIDETRSYYVIGIGDHECEIHEPEESARQVYMECMDRAMKGPVDGRYLFLSDEERRVHVEYLNQFADVVIKTKLVTASDGQVVRFSLINCPYKYDSGVFIIKAKPTGSETACSKAETITVTGYGDSEAFELFEEVIEAGEKGPIGPGIRYLVPPANRDLVI